MRRPEGANTALGLSLVALLVTLGLGTGSGRGRLVIGTGKWSAVPATLASAPAPSIEIETLQGDTVEIASDSQPTLVIAYRSTCPYSNASVKQWQELASMRCNLRITLVSPEPIERQVAYWRDRPWAARAGCAPIIIGRPSSTEAFVRAFDLTAFPMHYVIDRRGLVTGVWRGAVPNRIAKDSLLAGVQRLLGEARKE